MAAGTLSRTAMEEIIGRGESVIYKGRHISQVQDLPAESEMVQGNPDESASLVESIDAHIARLSAERDRIRERANQPAPIQDAPQQTGPQPGVPPVSLNQEWGVSTVNQGQPGVSTTDTGAKAPADQTETGGKGGKGKG